MGVSPVLFPGSSLTPGDCIVFINLHLPSYDRGFPGVSACLECEAREDLDFLSRHHVYAWCPLRPEEAVASLGTRVMEL